jgi:glycerophosphoryl diester phosphodiesterase
VQLLDESWLGRVGDAELARVAEYAVGIGPHHSEVDAELVDAAHRHGLVVHPYTVNSREELRRLAALGVDGVFTDFVVDFSVYTGRAGEREAERGGGPTDPG